MMRLALVAVVAAGMAVTTAAHAYSLHQQNQAAAIRSFKAYEERLRQP